MKKNIVSILLGLSLLIASGCDDFLDINTDPNSPVEVPLNQLLPAAQVTMAESVGMPIQGLSSITSYYMHQLARRGPDVNDYAVNGTTYEATTPWNRLYLRTLTDLREIMRDGTEAESWHYVGIAQLMRAYIYSILVDVYGDVPFNESNLGVENITPTFESGRDVYAAVFDLINEGQANLAKESALSPGADDFIYGGDLENWNRFANSLKLKLYNQIRLVDDVSEEVSALLALPLISEPSQDFELDYGSSPAPDDRNPAYTQEYAPGGQYYYINPYFYEIMRGTSTFFPTNILEGIRDPRIPYYWYNQLVPDEDPENPSSAHYPETGFLGLYSFSYNIDPNEGFDQSSSQSVAGLYPIGGRFDEGEGVTTDYNGYGSAPQRMLTTYAVLFTRAELALVGLTNEDPATVFEQAIRAAFAKVNEIANQAGVPLISEAAINSYVTSVMARFNEADESTKLNLIMTEKYKANFGFAVDIYTDYRRTGYPILHDAKTDILDITVRGREFPLSFPYPTDDLNLLPDQRQKNVYQDRVFWDVN